MDYEVVDLKRGEGGIPGWVVKATIELFTALLAGADYTPPAGKVPFVIMGLEDEEAKSE